jgi:hypothetical protein
MAGYYADHAAPTQTSTKKLSAARSRRMRLLLTLGCGLATLLLPLAVAAVADEAPPPSGTRPWVIGSAGTFALVEQYDYPYLVGLQYRSTPRTSWALTPGVGMALGPDGIGYFYADVAHDFALPQRWTITLSFAAGLFLNGDAIGANSHLEFQSEIALARQLANGARVGLAGFHISNGGIEQPNNGTEGLVLFLAVPVRPHR